MATSSSSIDTGNFQIFSSMRYDPDLAVAAAMTSQDAYPAPQTSPYYLLLYHYDRLLSAARCFGWDHAVEALQILYSATNPHPLAGFSETLNPFIPDKTKTWRLRILLSVDGTIAVEASPTLPFSSYTLLLPPPSPTNSPSFFTLPPPNHSQNTTPGNDGLWRLYLDTQPIDPSAFTTHKTTMRDVYTEARARARIYTLTELAEVLVYNARREVMEGSITTAYFQRRRASSSLDKNSGVEEVDWVTPPLSSGGNSGTTRRYALSRGFCVEEIVKTTDIIDGEECWLSNGVRGFFKAVIILNRGVV